MIIKRKNVPFYYPTFYDFLFLPASMYENTYLILPTVFFAAFVGPVAHGGRCEEVLVN